MPVGDHLPRRRRRDPALSRHPDRTARRAVDVSRGRLPDPVRRAADGRAAAEVDLRGHPPHVHPREHAQAVRRRVPLRRPPDGDVHLVARRPRHLLPRGQEHLRTRVAPQADPPADRQGADAGRDVLPVLGRPAVLPPRQRAVVPGQLPHDDVADRRVRGAPGARAGDGRAVHPPRRPRAELRHHGDARPSAPATPSPTRRRHRRRRRCTGRCTAAPTRRSCTCSPRSARSRTCRRSSTR